MVCGYLAQPAADGSDKDEDEDSLESDGVLATYADNRIRDIVRAAAAPPAPSVAVTAVSKGKAAGRLPEDYAIAVIDEVASLNLRAQFASQ